MTYYAIQDGQIADGFGKPLMPMPPVVHEFPSQLERDEWVGRGVCRGEAYRRAVRAAEVRAMVGKGHGRVLASSTVKHRVDADARTGDGRKR